MPGGGGSEVGVHSVPACGFRQGVGGRPNDVLGVLITKGSFSLYSFLSGDPEMGTVIKRPVNQTACMQHLQRLVSSGHYFWCADVIPEARLASFVDKWSVFGLTADIPARAYRKKCGKASVHLCLEPMMEEGAPIRWWMLSTAGKFGLSTHGAVPGMVRDCRLEEGRLTFGHYELVRQPKLAGAEQGAPTTWTWRLSQQRYKEWEALLVERIKARDLDGLAKAERCLCTMPMFSGVREQVKRLFAERNKLAGKFKLQLPQTPDLPVMRMVKLWE